MHHTTRFTELPRSYSVLSRKSTRQESIGPGHRRVEIMTSTLLLNRSLMLVWWDLSPTFIQVQRNWNNIIRELYGVEINASRSLASRNDEETSQERGFPSARYGLPPLYCAGWTNECRQSDINRFILRIRCHDVARCSMDTRNMKEASI